MFRDEFDGFDDYDNDRYQNDRFARGDSRREEPRREEVYANNYDRLAYNEDVYAGGFDGRDSYGGGFHPQQAKKKRGFFDSFKNSLKNEGEDEISPYIEGSYPNNVIISYPTTYKDVQTLIDNLKHRQPVIVDLAQINDDGAQRILDFMSGAIYALSGSMSRITGSIFLLTPDGMSIRTQKELKKRLENK